MTTGLMSKTSSTAAPAPRARRRHRSSGLAAAVLTAAVAATAALAPAASAAEPWGFEQVTPVDKGSGTVSSSDTFQTSPDGETFLHTSMLPYDGVPSESIPGYLRYVARRGATAWSNRAIDPPYGPGTGYVQAVLGTSPDFSHALVASRYALAPGGIEGGGNLYMRDTRTGEYTLVAASNDTWLVRQFVTNMGTQGVKYVAPDGRSALFTVASPSLLPGVPDLGQTGSPYLYRWSADDGLSIESVLPDSEGGARVSIAYAGNDDYYGPRDSIAVDADGLAHVYFTALVNNEIGTFMSGVYVRSGGETRAVSVSQIPGDPSTPVPARVQAIGEGGRYMLFNTLEEKALTEDTPADVGDRILYRYDASDESLTYVGAMSAEFSTTGFQQVVGMTRDGQTVAFRSPSVLADGAIQGRENLYVWRDGELRLVWVPDSGSSGENAGNHLRRLSANGRYLAFTDNSSPLAQFGTDNVSARCPTMLGTPGPCDNVYLYDFGADELTCVTCRPSSGPPSGNAGDPLNKNEGAARLNTYHSRIVADDGTVFFTTSDGLVPGDGNGLDDAYAYRDGELRLLSRAAQGMRARFLDATADGKTVFFSTDDPIVGTDNDRSVDIYMTRAGAGFPYTAPVVTPPCSGSDCRDPFAPAAPLSVAGSVAFSGLGNVDGRPSAGSVRVSKLRTAIGAGAWLRVRVPAAGRVRVSGPGLKRSSTTARKAGSYRVAVRLSKRARQRLKDDRRVRVRVTVRFAPKAGRPSAKRFAMTFKASSTRKGR